MGLDIQAFKELKEYTGDDAWEYDDDEERDIRDRWITGEYVEFYPNGYFPGREGDIKADTAYTFEDDFGFRAGSYGGYGVWRNNLARLAGYPLTSYEQDMGFGGEEHIVVRSSHQAAAWELEEGVFFELIMFSDCEGVLGTEVCAKLYKDFCENEHIILSEDEFFIQKWFDWKAAFNMGQQNGCVVFQ